MRIFLKGILFLVVGLAVGGAGFFIFSKTSLYAKWRQGAGPGIIQEALPIVYYNDPDVGPMLLPRTKIHYKTPYFDTSVVTNREGFTGRDYPLSKSNYRIAILGDSAVEAYAVVDESRFPHVTESMVYKKTNGRLKVDVMGFGISGWGSVHHYAALRKYVLKYQPDEVWLEFLPTNDLGDNTPLMNGPPNGPTFIYRNAESNEIVDIRFGYPELPDALHDERKRRYGEKVSDTWGKWHAGLQPYYWSPEINPHWELILDHTWQTLKLIKTLCDQAGVKKVAIVYRMTGYDNNKGELSAYQKEASAFLKHDLPMEQELGRRRFREKVTSLGFDFIDTHDMKASGINTRSDEIEPAKHANMADFFSDVIINRLTASARTSNLKK